MRSANNSRRCVSVISIRPGALKTPYPPFKRKPGSLPRLGPQPIRKVPTNWARVEESPVEEGPLEDQAQFELLLGLEAVEPLVIKRQKRVVQVEGQALL